ncbi:LutB/LldF family L-lactate oxidation iron-sulfur protein [Priestia megaterium]|jgi:L-lactate dehydrogenase complex protein LldF|uniref:LutB/LldF family L-lactate oxidation iron-sulfur protein n=1 Tax=Priestia megaterium TaxID=1404 RepID=UPI0013E2D2B4|nr:LutB/LldF family L-lactate oxidation iron-sulfur protein [Priestia megaterium]MDI3092280.1 LutB/LldF family L-lactate oxidation iron-sulfur protein [Priestia megaterium]MED3864500.1 LutB/LldF family L-lactate oxidation iron-sulfur protein [Priestia megaterium]MED4099219.1 LutB/LldF family L-lactate oxidation iron-sulfur protein [Priestia megaterium]MED4144571.1 LutB/LldF family L-lactate oxidation iron-sulfur protein [Priestia megaterium]MED4165870.1 LutB/LldF family L-lactate oxidation iro
MSMKIGNDQFKKRVDDGVNNAFMRFAVSSAQERLRSRRLDAAEELGNWEEWRALGEEIRQHTLENLDYYLEQLTDNVAKRGGHVFFAQTAEEANEYIKDVARKKQAKKVVKSKSMVTEEIHMNAALEELGCEVIETDLGEYILQVDDHDPPSHIVAPALHKNKEQIRDVFQEKLSYKKTEKPEELALHAREMLRKEFLSADIGITGCNFAIAESGSISLVTNEGNARLTTALPKTQITVMGMERIVPTFEEFEVLVSLLTRSAVGQRLTSYVTALTGPRLPGEVDGPEEFHLVIVDNGRSAILGTEFQSVLQCIRCAACVNVCPVYRHIGGHSYGSIYSGPIGAVLSPLLGGYEDYKELPYASTLCAACTDACPVKIPLHELLHKHRQRIVEKEGKAPISEKLAMKAFGLGAASSSLYTVGAKVAPAALTPFMSGSSISKGPGPLKAWTESREFPAPTKERLRDWFDKRSDGDERKHSK